jgi:hypothetical protein
LSHELVAEFQQSGRHLIIAAIARYPKALLRFREEINLVVSI